MHISQVPRADIFRDSAGFGAPYAAWTARILRSLGPYLRDPSYRL